MKKLLFFAFVAFVLAGCTQVIEPKQAVHIYNSAWQEIDPNAAAKVLGVKAIAKDAMIGYRKSSKRCVRARLVAMHVDARGDGKVELVLQVERTDNWGENIRIPL